MPKPKKIQYSGESKVINAIVNIANWLLDNYYELPIASSSVLGGIKIGSRLSIDANGVLSADDQSYTLPIAGANNLGGVKVGENLSIDANGVLSADASPIGDVNITNPTDGQVLKYDSQNSEWKNDNIPAATTNSLGLVKVGNGLSVYNGILSADNQVFNFGKVKNATFTNGWGSIGDPIYIYDPGLYLVGASADYGGTISSGEIGIRIRVGVSGSSSIYGEVRKTVSDPANENEYINTFVVVELTASTSTVSCDCYAGTSEYIKKGIVSHFAIKL